MLRAVPAAGCDGREAVLSSWNRRVPGGRLLGARKCCSTTSQALPNAAGGPWQAALPAWSRATATSAPAWCSARVLLLRQVMGEDGSSGPLLLSPPANKCLCNSPPPYTSHLFLRPFCGACFICCHGPSYLLRGMLHST